MKLSKDKKIAIITAAFAAVMMWQAVQIKPLFPPTAGDCGPAFFPTMCCVGIILCSVGKFFLPVAKESNAKFLSKEGWLKIGLMMLWLIGYTLGLNYLGYILASIPAFFLLIMLFTWNEKRNYIIAAVYSTTFTLMAYVLFTKVLSVMLPAGKLF